MGEPASPAPARRPRPGKGRAPSAATPRDGQVGATPVAAEGAAPVSYAAAEAELEEILRALEGEGVDVDELSGHVKRAKALITWCRAQVAEAEIAITDLLDDDSEPRGPTPD